MPEAKPRPWAEGTPIPETATVAQIKDVVEAHDLPAQQLANAYTVLHHTLKGFEEQRKALDKRQQDALAVSQRVERLLSNHLAPNQTKAWRVLDGRILVASQDDYFGVDLVELEKA